MFCAATANPLIYTALFAPTPGIQATNASITVAAGLYTDAALNPGGAGTTPAIAIDTLAPALAITSDVAAVNAGGTANIAFTFSEDSVMGFTAADVVTTGAY